VRISSLYIQQVTLAFSSGIVNIQSFSINTKLEMKKVVIVNPIPIGLSMNLPSISIILTQAISMNAPSEKEMRTRILRNLLRKSFILNAPFSSFLSKCDGS